MVADSFGSAGEITAQEALFRGLSVGLESHLPGLILAPLCQRPKSTIDIAGKVLGHVDINTTQACTSVCQKT